MTHRENHDKLMISQDRLIPILVKAIQDLSKQVEDFKKTIKIGGVSKMFNAKTIDNFISKEECDYLVNTVKNVEPWEAGGSDFWDNRSLNAINVYNNIDKAAGELLYKIKQKIEVSILELYNEPVIYSDLFQIVRWFPEMEQPPHADDMTNSEGNDWFHHRHYGVILYLNDDYEGGHTFYPQHNFEIIPKAGTLAIHPGDPDHLHGVTKIKNSKRYTVASFWTREEEYSDKWVL